MKRENINYKHKDKLKIKVIIDYDGTLTQEEKQVEQLAELAFDTLSKEILKVPKEIIKKDYYKIQHKILTFPHKFTWKVNGISACYSNEGAFVLNTVTIQEMLSNNKFYKSCVEKVFDSLEYDPVAECTNYLFHKNSALIKPLFRVGAKETLIKMIKHPQIQPIVMTNSKTDKVKQHLETIGITQQKEFKIIKSFEISHKEFKSNELDRITDEECKNDELGVVTKKGIKSSKFEYKGISGKSTMDRELEYDKSEYNKLDYKIEILGDTRQYHMDQNWDHYFDHSELGKIQILPIYEKFKIDLRRPIYYQALIEQAKDGSKIIAVGDIFSLVGSVPLMMGMDFILLKAPYVPKWSETFVRKHPNGKVIENIPQLLNELEMFD